MSIIAGIEFHGISNAFSSLLTEDNCVPRADWVARLAAAREAGADIVGGTMGNAHPGVAIDTGAFLAEYGFFGEARMEPGTGSSPMVRFTQFLNFVVSPLLARL